jgi:ribosomal protein S18 acetylase RimI-like enzyme
MVHGLTEKAEIRRRLNRDRPWSLFALADLDDEMFAHCEWWGAGDSLALVFHALSIRPIFVLGDAASTRDLLGNLSVPSGYLNLKPGQTAAAEGIYSYRERHEMHRMMLDDFRPRGGAVEPLGPADRQDIERLYGTGDGGGIAFSPFQLCTGYFRGIRREGELVAVGGVQVVSRNESAAGVGNIFTRPDCRGQGLAQVVTSAVVSALRESGIGTIGLNVECTNIAAVRAYQAIGFRSYFTYYEGMADRCA